MRKWSIAAVTLVFVLPGAATAAGAGQGAGDDWRFSVTPIAFWGLNMEGPVVIRRVARNVDASFSDIKNSFDSAAGLGFSCSNGAWKGFVNGSYLKLLDEDVTSSLAPGIAADVSLEWTTVELGGAFRLPVPPGGKAPNVEVMAGARYNKLKGEIEATRGATFDETSEVTWTDPFVGMSIAQPITKGLLAVLRGDVGGFSLSSNQSKYTWNFTAGMAYRWRMSGWGLNLFGGYKMSEFDYENPDPNEFQMIQRMQGPVVSLDITF